MEAVSMNTGGGLTAADAHREFRIALPGVDVDAVEVETVEGVETVDADYAYRVRISSTEILDGEALMGRPASLALGLEPEPWVVHGLVAGVEDAGDGADSTTAVVTLRSPLFGLIESMDHRVFRRMTAPAIAREVLEASMAGGGEVRVEATDQSPEHDLVVQDRETDLDFLHRILARDGLFLLVRQEEDGAVVVIHDDLAAAGGSELTLRFERSSGQVQGSPNTVDTVRRICTSRPEQVQVADFDPDYPQESQSGTASRTVSTPGLGTLGLYGCIGGGREAHERLASVVQRACDSHRSAVEITTARRLAPGMRVTLEAHPNKALNRGYVVVEAEHQGDQAAAIHGGEDSGRASYRCLAKLHEASIGFHAVPRQPSVTGGLLLGAVEGEQDDKAHLNEEGAYRIRLAQDEGEAGNAEASPPVRAIQPYGGRDYGLHFPMLPRTSVAMAGINGDSERPVILGALSSPRQPSPVNTENPYEHVLRTASGHELVLDDTPDARAVRLAAAEGAGELSMVNEAGSHHVALRTSDEGSMELISGGDMTVNCGGSRRVEVTENYAVDVGEDYSLRAEAGALEWGAAETLSLVSDEGDVLHEATEGDVSLSAGEELALEAGTGLSMVSEQGDVSWAADAGSVAIEVEEDIALVTTGDGDIQLGGEHGLRIGGDGTLQLSADAIELTADVIALVAAEIVDN